MFSIGMNFNEGEVKMQQLLHVPGRDNPTSTMLTPQASFLLQRAPILAIGTLDAQNRPWTSLWGGSPGFSQPLGGGVIGTRTIVDGKNDPVVQALVGGVAKGEMIHNDTKMFAGLTIDLMTRKRVKIFGHMIAGSVDEVEVEYTENTQEPEGSPETQDQIQFVSRIEQSLGNCPKYLNQYEIRPALVKSQLISRSSALTVEAQTLISKVDMFFLSSSTDEDMDTNHRGGPPGFVRILSPTEIVYPEYSGNQLYQSLGNLQMNPHIGITFPDYDTGNVLYITGSAEILVGADASSLLPSSNLALKITIDEVRFVESGLAFRGIRKDPSPYNPLVRTLAAEGNIKSLPLSSQKTAQLVRRSLITPSISRFTFLVPEGVQYKPGQWVAFDFKKDLDHGYSHMRNEDPQSLNDDFVRTFTISSTPKTEAEEKEFDITIRRVGPVTGHLFKQNEHTMFEVQIIGIGGEFRIQQGEGMTPFVAGGVGITPLLGHLKELVLEPGRLRLLWSIRLGDADFVLDTLQQFPTLAQCTGVFFTGNMAPDDIEDKIRTLKSLGVKVKTRRVEKRDLDDLGAETWYLCAGKTLRKQVLGWLEGKKVFYEDFDY